MLIRRKKIQCKNHRLRIAKTALVCLKAESPSQSNLGKGHKFNDFRKKAVQDSSYNKKTTKFIYCKGNKLLICNATLKMGAIKQTIDI